MFIVYVRDSEDHKTILFCTKLLVTATSFIHNFGTEMNELSKHYMKEYYNKRPLNKNWFYESGWNAKIQNFADRFNMHITKKMDFESIEYMITSGECLDYEKANLL